jgi:hypothetical protein
LAIDAVCGKRYQLQPLKVDLPAAPLAPAVGPHIKPPLRLFQLSQLRPPYIGYGELRIRKQVENAPVTDILGSIVLGMELFTRLTEQLRPQLGPKLPLLLGQQISQFKLIPLQFNHGPPPSIRVSHLMIIVATESSREAPHATGSRANYFDYTQPVNI